MLILSLSLRQIRNTVLFWKLCSTSWSTCDHLKKLTHGAAPFNLTLWKSFQNTLGFSYPASIDAVISVCFYFILVVSSSQFFAHQNCHHHHHPHLFLSTLSLSPVSHKHEDLVTLNPFRKSDFSKLRHNSATNQRAPLPLYRLLTKRRQENRKLILGEWFWDIIYLNIQSIDNIKGRTL